MTNSDLALNILKLNDYLTSNSQNDTELAVRCEIL